MFSKTIVPRSLQALIRCASTCVATLLVAAQAHAAVYDIQAIAPIGKESHATGINNLGQVSFDIETCDDTPGQCDVNSLPYAGVYQPGFGPVDLKPALGYSHTRGIDDNGVLSGVFGVPCCYGLFPSQEFEFSTLTGEFSFGSIGWGFGTVGHGQLVNSSGWSLSGSVGYYNTYNFLTVPGVGSAYLQALLPENSGWTSLQAVGINDHGQIAGTGNFAGNPTDFFGLKVANRTAFLMTLNPAVAVPEAQTWWLLLAGLATLAGLKKSRRLGKA